MDWITLSILSALFLALHEVLRKKILKLEHSMELLSVTFLIVFIIHALLVPFYTLSITSYELFLTFLRSIITAVSFLLITKSLKHMEISTVAPLNNLSPLFLIFFSFIFLSEVITLIQFLGILLLIIGSYFLQVHNNYLNFSKHLKLLKNKYIIYCILAALFLTFSAIFSKIILRTVPVMTYLFYSYLFITIFFVSLTFILYSGFKDLKKGFSKGSFIIPLIAFLFLISEWTYFLVLAMPTVLVTLVLPLRRLSTLFAVVIGGSIFHDHYLKHKIVSSFVMLLGVFLIVL